MSLFLTIVILTLMLCMAIEDIRFRAIHLVYFPALLIFSLLLGLEKIGINALFMAGLTNLGILALQLGVLFLFTYIREKKAGKLFKKYLGIGDVFFLCCISFLFSPLNFCLFITVVLLLLLIINLFLFQLKSTKEKKIPLAGQMALAMIVILTFSEVSGFSFYNDTLTGDFLFAALS